MRRGAGAGEMGDSERRLQGVEWSFPVTEKLSDAELLIGGNRPIVAIHNAKIRRDEMQI